MDTITMELVFKIKKIALKKGYVKDERIDISALAQDYLKAIDYQEDNKDIVFKKFKSVYRTFKNFFGTNKNWTNETLEKICKTLW